MPIPMRMNLVAVELKQFSVADTRRDPDFNEPKQGASKAYGPTLALKAQV